MSDIAAPAQRAESDIDRLERLERLATRMDSFLRVPGTPIRLGLDSVLGLIPGIGDALALAPAGYIVTEAWRMGAPGRMIGRMLGNIAIDTTLGTVPLLGDVFDVFWKGNRRNVVLLRKHVETRSGQPD